MEKFTMKILTLIMAIIIISVLPFTILADDKGLLVTFKITSGLDTGKEKADTEKLETKKPETEVSDITKESTFDEKRTITGTADKETTVTIQVYNINEKLEKEEAGEEFEEEDLGVVDDITVGASGIFSQTIDLEIGENIINITVSKEGYKTVERQFIVNRKNREIKQELEKTIVLPGDRTVVQPTKIP